MKSNDILSGHLLPIAGINNCIRNERTLNGCEPPTVITYNTKEFAEVIRLPRDRTKAATPNESMPYQSLRLM